MPPAVSNLHFSDSCIKHYVAKSVIMMLIFPRGLWTSLYDIVIFMCMHAYHSQYHSRTHVHVRTYYLKLNAISAYPGTMYFVMIVTAIIAPGTTLVASSFETIIVQHS